jgi:hypothetical protein
MRTFGIIVLPVSCQPIAGAVLLAFLAITAS